MTPIAKSKGSTTVTTVHFVVDGEGLTDIVRNVWTYDPTKALDILGNIDGIDAKTARAILSGKKKLIGRTVCDDKRCSQCKGQTPMKLVKDKAKDYYVEKKKWEAAEQKRIAEESQRLADEQEIDELAYGNGEEGVLSRYESTPERMEAVAKWREKRDAAVARGGNGALWDLMRAKNDPGDDQNIKNGLGMNRTLRELNAAERLGMSALPPEVQAASKAMLDNMLKEPDDSMPVPDDITLADGLLSPSGEWYSVTYGLHKDVARRIWNNQNPDDKLGDVEAEEKLDDAGWVKVGNYMTSIDRLREVYHKEKAGPVTEPQKETLKRWSDKYALEFRWNSQKTNYLGFLALLREGY